MALSLIALPPELRSLCRKLTSTKTEQLPHLLPALLKDVQRCHSLLSAPQESKIGTHSSEAAVLVHKLRTQITALLNGRSVEGRFAAIGLIKAVIDVGGWECLRTSEPWVRGLLSVLQKRDPMVMKELSVVTLTKVYTSLQGYPTLIREIATPTLPAFATACLQILRPAGSKKASPVAFGFTETVFEALSALIPLYPTTLRPFAAQIRTAARPYLAPTSSDNVFVSEELRRSSRRLVVRLHMTAAKAGGAEEWVKYVSGLIKDSHVIADQLFRAVREHWESRTGYNHEKVDLESEPHGGDESSDHLPLWTGIQAGSERLIGLLDFLAECLRCRTKVPITIPLTAIIDLSSRISSILLPTPGQEKLEAMELNPAIGRDEKDELWSVFPDIQVAVMRLLLELSGRLGRSFLPLAQEALDHTVRMFQSGYRLPDTRIVSFHLVKRALHLCGPTMAESSVKALALVIQSCCRDLLGCGGHLRAPKRQAISTMQNGSKPRSAAQNSDSFLSSNAGEEMMTVTLEKDHIAVAEELLETLFSHLPQEHINPSLRALMLRTAILCHVKSAQIASVLHPARDKNGRTPQVILPYLHRQFPHDQNVDILRFNFRTAVTAAKDDFMDLDDEAQPGEQVQTSKPTGGFAFDKPFEPAVPETGVRPMEVDSSSGPVPQVPEALVTAQESPFLPKQTTQTATNVEAGIGSAQVNPLKRKGEEPESIAAKRFVVDSTKLPAADPGFSSLGSLVDSSLQEGHVKQATDAGEDDSDDDESVHLNMELDSDDDEEDSGE